MRKNLLTAAIFSCIVTAFTGCSTFSQPDSEGYKLLRKTKPARILKSLAVLPLYESRKTDDSRLYECPITHVAVTSGKVPGGVGEKLALTLHQTIKKRTGATITSAYESFDVFKDFRNKVGFSYSVDTASEIGKKLGVDAVFLGSVLRYSEREGGAFAVGKPASLAFTFALIEVHNKQVLWTAMFDHTQKPLSDNILKFRSFWNSGMRWLTVKELASNAAETMSEKLAFFLKKDM